ncbi:MAG: asparagine synthase-related protein, partial [Gemmataceae bacterium]
RFANPGGTRGANPDPFHREVIEMDHKSFLGGVWKRGAAPAPAGEDWGWVAPGTELFLRGAASCSRVFKWDGVALLLRGYARSGGGALDLDRVADDIYRRYRATGSLAVDGLDGAFTLALLDSRCERVVLYRNLIGTGFTYYRPTGDGMVFGGNLTEMLPLLPEVRPNKAVLPAFYLYRCVPGRETLFDGVYRLLPGEEVTWEPARFSRVQRHTFADLKAEAVPAKEAVERTDATMAAILRDVEALRPGAANLLSGGVDSSYIQAVYNQDVYRGEELPASYCIAVDHPMTWIDTDYAVTASMAIGTRHVLTPADGPYPAYLADGLARTAEPMNHVQSAYFGHLARAMADDGVKAGLCGEGADSLFGVGMANKLHNARVIERLLPSATLRRLAGGAAGVLGWDALRRTIGLAGRRGDEACPDHPVNQVAAFTDRAAVVRCFGEDAVREAEAKRRALLDLYEVGDDPLDRLHATGFLGEAMDSAGLWATMFQRAGVDLLCPFLDSRMIRLALNLPHEVRYTFRRPKAVLKAALSRRAPAEIATRVKLGFGQPVFEWLRPGGQLASLVSRVAGHGGVRAEVGPPTWFTYSAVCYDVWHRLFIERSLPRPVGPTPARREAVGV